MALVKWGKHQGDEDEGSLPQGEVNWQKAGLNPACQENRKISGSLPGALTS